MVAPIWSIEVFPRGWNESNQQGPGVVELAPEDNPRGRALQEEIRSLGWDSVPEIVVSDIYFIQSEGADSGANSPLGLDPEKLKEVVEALLSDPVTQGFSIEQLEGGEDTHSWREALHRATVLKRAGVMDPSEASALHGLADLGLTGFAVRTATRFYFYNKELNAGQQEILASKVLSNPVIEEVFWDRSPIQPPFQIGGESQFQKNSISLEGLDDDELMKISQEGQLSLDLNEMRTIQAHYSKLGRPPSDIELETLAQTWSEHCCHKTFTGVIDYRRVEPDGTETKEVIDNLLKQTIKKATDEIDAPWCLSVFVDNAGVVALDEEYGVSFKVETHNHPSAIEPYGGAGTGIGGVIRDTLGTGLGARPIINTDVFCFGPLDLEYQDLPQGTLHPLRVMRGVVGGVRDYGNRMGIPTANGAVYFDERYIGNPLVFCGSVGLIPRSQVDKEVRPGDLIYAMGGRTGRDGIHGATFSSVELTEESEVVSSGAVQIGNAITEKKVLDVLLEARDRGLYRAITDCGAGGFSSAVGEMGEQTGAKVDLEKAPLKYDGLTYTEIWISEAQERMVFAVPPENAQALEELAASEEVECVCIGEFTDSGRLELFYRGESVGDLSMEFLHDGNPRFEREAVYQVPAHQEEQFPTETSAGQALHRILSSPNVASKEWIIRQYDHEVQGLSVVKAMQGPRRDGPGDACAFTPRFESDATVVVGCGMNPCYGDLDPYRMALSAIDEAIRNIVATGGDPDRVAILDNFAWGNTRRPQILGQLVEAAKGCADGALGFGTPFISGKDSLNNEFQVGGKAINIPPSLLISSLSVVDSAHQLISMDLKASGNALLLIGDTKLELGGSHYFRTVGGEGGIVPDVDLVKAKEIFQKLYSLVEEGWVLSAHDLSEGGLAVAAAEMAFAGEIGAKLELQKVLSSEDLQRDDALLFSESNSRFLIEVSQDRVDDCLKRFGSLPIAQVGQTVDSDKLEIVGLSGESILEESLASLRDSWQRLSKEMGPQVEVS